MEQALEKAGIFEFTPKLTKADVVFFDHEPGGDLRSDLARARWEKFRKLTEKKKVFIYPHTPYGVFLWDGYITAWEHVACNFVPNIAFQQAMKIYGYSCRTEAIGFSRPLKVKKFSPTSGKNVAFSGPRLMGKNGGWFRDADKLIVIRALEWLANNRKHFDKVTVYYTFDEDKAALSKFKNAGFDFVCVAKNSYEVKMLNTASSLKQLQGIDLFIGSNTLGFIALSQGIPTILIGHDNEFPMHSTNRGNRYNEYAHIVDFPYRLHEMSIDEVMQLCQQRNRTIEEWKKINVGKSFDKDKFLNIVKEFV